MHVYMNVVSILAVGLSADSCVTWSCKVHCELCLCDLMDQSPISFSLEGNWSILEQSTSKTGLDISPMRMTLKDSRVHCL